MGKINKLSEIPNLDYKLVKEIVEMEKQCFFVNVFNYTNELFLNDNIDFKKILYNCMVTFLENDEDGVTILYLYIINNKTPDFDLIKKSLNNYYNELFNNEIENRKSIIKKFRDIVEEKEKELFKYIIDNCKHEKILITLEETMKYEYAPRKKCITCNKVFEVNDVELFELYENFFKDGEEDIVDENRIKEFVEKNRDGFNL